MKLVEIALFVKFVFTTIRVLHNPNEKKKCRIPREKLLKFERKMRNENLFPRLCIFFQSNSRVFFLILIIKVGFNTKLIKIYKKNTPQREKTIFFSFLSWTPALFFVATLNCQNLKALQNTFSYFSCCYFSFLINIITLKKVCFVYNKILQRELFLLLRLIFLNYLIVFEIILYNMRIKTHTCQGEENKCLFWKPFQKLYKIKKSAKILYKHFREKK